MLRGTASLFALHRTLFILICLMAVVLPAKAAGPNERPRSALGGRKVALVIPSARYNRFLHEELMAAFSAKGVDVTIVSSRMGIAAPNKGDKTVQVEMTIGQVDMSAFDALVFAGGGTLYTEFANQKRTNDVIGQALALNKVLAGIDIGKAVLVNSGLIDYRLPAQRDMVGGSVSVSGKVITANAQYVVQPFIKSLFDAMRQE